MRSLSRVLLFILMSAACSRKTTPAVPDPKPREPAEPSAIRNEPGAIVQVISVRKNSAGNMNAVNEYCIRGEGEESGGIIYKGLPYRLDGINLRFPDGTAADLIEKSPALLVTMTKKQNLASVLVSTQKPCNSNEPIMAQARSDWGTPECGQGLPCFRTLAALAAHSYWEVTAVEAFSGFSVTSAGDGQSLNVRITNVFSSKQQAMELTAHYEGGPGKPMPRFLKIPVPELAPGASFEAKVHRVVDEKDAPVVKTPGHRSRFYDLYYLEMTGTLRDGDVEIAVHVNTSVFSLFPQVFSDSAE